MSIFKTLRQFNLGIKIFVISWWSIVITSYIWLIGYTEKNSLWVDWLSVLTTTLIAAAGINHLTSLYQTPVRKFTVDFVWPVFFVSIGALLLIAGATLGALNKGFCAETLSAVSVLSAVVAIMYGSDSGPKK